MWYIEDLKSIDFVCLPLGKLKCPQMKWHCISQFWTNRWISCGYQSISSMLELALMKSLPFLGCMYLFALGNQPTFCNPPIQMWRGTVLSFVAYYCGSTLKCRLKKCEFLAQGWNAIVNKCDFREGSHYFPSSLLLQHTLYDDRPLLYPQSPNYCLNWLDCGSK